MADRPSPEMMSEIRWRVMLSILGPAAWLSFTLLYVGFWAHGFTLFQSVVVILVSLVLLIGVLGGAWAYWGMRHERWMNWGREAPPSA